MRSLLHRLAITSAILLLGAGSALAQVSESEAPPPAASEPAAASSPAAPPPAPGEEAVAPASAAKHPSIPTHFDVEPANARLRVTASDWIYASPSTSARKIERSEPGKYVDVNGATRHWLRVQLKSGQTGYIKPASVDLVKPTDKIFQLTTNASVRDEPNRWGKQLAEVHRGHDVHVIGLALSYMKIRMKNGTEGYIPVTALQ